MSLYMLLVTLQATCACHRRFIKFVLKNHKMTPWEVWGLISECAQVVRGTDKATGHPLLLTNANVNANDIHGVCKNFELCVRTDDYQKNKVLL